MAKPSGQSFSVRISPVGADELLFEELSVAERLSEPYTFELTAWSENSAITAEEVLGKPMTVTCHPPKGGERYYSGLVSRFACRGSTKFAQQVLYRYEFRLQPWLWFLTRAADCRVFQQKKVVDIFETVVKQHGFSAGEDYELHLQGSSNNPKREYCVQYGETDFNFLSRLLEDAGIWYYFRHTAGKHTMVLVDALSAHPEPAGPYSTVHYVPVGSALVVEDHLESWWVEHSVQTGIYTSTDYNFETPALSLLSKSNPPAHRHTRSTLEVYEYPVAGEVSARADVESVVKLRRESLEAQYERFHGEGPCLGLATGKKFRLEHHPHLDGGYLVTATNQTIRSNQYMAGQKKEGTSSVALEAIKDNAVYRPPRIARKPIIHGAQTAVVVGESDAEIHTDRHGRVKVQFRWDRKGNNDAQSSCWIRVAQAWAGEGWGAVYIPRVGHEVVVSFLEGDPDRPLVTGSVYHGTNTPPYALPGDKTKSTLKSKSSPKGEGSNELRFEDKKGSEEVYVHAQKDMLTKVEHDQTANIEHDRTLTTGHDETHTVKHDHKLTTENDETYTVKHDRKLTVEHDEARTVKNDQTTSIQGNEKRDVAKKRTTSVGDNDALTVGKNQTATVSQSYSLTAGKEISLEVGASRLVMKADGTIELVGTKISIKSLDRITVAATQFKLNGTAMVEVQGAAVKVQGSSVLQLNSSGITSLSGSLTKIG